MKKIFALFLLTFTLSFASNAVAQTSPIKIVSRHPDFNIKVKRCVASGGVVILDLIMTNTGEYDINNFDVYGGAGGNNSTTIYDSEGNQYGGHYASGSDVKIKSGVKSTYSSNDIGDRTFVANVPLQVSLRIEGVPTSVESIALVQLSVNAPAWSLTYNTPRSSNPQLRNIPITRN